MRCGKERDMIYGTAKSYRIERIFENGSRKQVLARGLTEEEAQAWCRDPEGSSLTCIKRTNINRTKRRGRWFECYQEDK